MVTCAICEDDTVFSGELAKLAAECVGLANIQIEEFCDGESLCRRVLEEEIFFDIILMDIELVERNGIETAEMIRGNPIYGNSIIIFISSHVELVIEAFDVNPFHFLHKPVTTKKFREVFCAAMAKADRAAQFFEFKKHRVFYRIPISHIYYFASSSHYVRIVQKDKEETMKAKLDDVEGKLMEINTWDFIRIHKSALVNLNHVKDFYPKGVRMGNGQFLTISAPYLEAYRKRLADYISYN